MSDGNGSGPGTGQTAGERPLGTVVASAAAGLRVLARRHVELAKLEAKEAAAVRAQGVGMMGAAGVLAMYAVGFIAAAGAAALALVLPVWAAILIVGAMLLAVAAVLVLVGRRTVRKAPDPSVRTKQNLEESVRWAKKQIAR